MASKFAIINQFFYTELVLKNSIVVIDFNVRQILQQISMDKKQICLITSTVKPPTSYTTVSKTIQFLDMTFP